MRTSFVSVVVLTAAIGLPLAAAAQPDTAVAPGDRVATSEQGASTSTTTRSSKPGSESRDQAATPAPAQSPASLKGRSNVQIELTITDQTGSGPVEKKTVSMIAASGTWGKIRASGVARPNERGGPGIPVGLNVDARPFVFPEGVVQVELTIGYNPLGSQPAETSPLRPTDLNQSLTVVLQNGKPLVVSQAADPIIDRKIIVEVKATVLK